MARCELVSAHPLRPDRQIRAETAGSVDPSGAIGACGCHTENCLDGGLRPCIKVKTMIQLQSNGAPHPGASRTSAAGAAFRRGKSSGLTARCLSS